MFKNTPQTVDTRMAVIEEKFNVYEKMMNKLENAIQTISEINQNISRMLTIHEEKIDSSVKTDEIIFEKLRRMEEKNSEEHQKVIDKIEKFETEIKSTLKGEEDTRKKDIKDINTQVEGIKKFRWIFVGAIAVVMFIFSNQTVIVDILTPNTTPDRIQPVK